jgi:O-antigen ligase
MSRAETADGWWLAGTVAVLTWGALAFGSVYPWAYWPLVAGSILMGVAGLAFGRGEAAPWSLLLGLVTIAGAISVQLIPVQPDVLAALTPSGERIIREHDIAYGVGAALKHPISIEPARTWLGLTFFVAFTVLLLGTARFLRRRSARTLSTMIVVISVALAIIGMAQNAMFNGKVYGFWELRQGGSVFGPFINHNHFAGWMLMAIPLAIGYLMSVIAHSRKRGGGLRDFMIWLSTTEANVVALAGFAVLLMTLSLFLTLSRSGIAALLFALLVSGVVVARRLAGSRRLAAMLYLALMAVVVAAWVGVDQIVSQYRQIDLNDINERPAIWRDTIHIARDFWLTGTGLNTYGVSTLYYQAAIPGQHLREAHSDYLQLAAEGGLLLVLPICGAILAFAIAVRRRLRQDVGSIVWLRIGAATSLTAIALQSAVEFSLQIPANAALVAVIAGLAIHDGRYERAVESVD